MSLASALVIAAALTAGAGNDLKAYAACRTESRVARSGGCAWRSGSLFATNGWYSTRVVFRAGHPKEVVIYQPGVSGPSEFIPAEAEKMGLHVADLSAIDGDYLVCALRPLADPSDPKAKLDTACLAGAKHLRTGTIVWVFSEVSRVTRKRISR